MLHIITCVSLIKLFINGFDCYIFETDIKETNENIDQILQKYMKPIQRLTERFPNHDVEVQLEVASADSPNVLPAQSRKANSRAFAPHMYHASAALPVDVAGSQNIYIPSNEFHKLPIKMLNYRRKGMGKPKIRKPPSKVVARRAGEEPPTTVNLKENTNTPLNEKTPSNSESLTPSKTTTTSSNEDSMQPIYLTDLKKAMKEFEKKIIAIQKAKDPHTAHNLEEGKKPLLKKDLWIALGLQQANSVCPGCSEKPGKDTTTNKPPEKTKTKTKKTTKYTENPPVNSNLENIITLLKNAGVKFERDIPKKGKQNIHWIQLKIPKKKSE